MDQLIPDYLMVSVNSYYLMKLSRARGPSAHTHTHYFLGLGLNKVTGCERLTIAFWMHCSYTICLFVCLFVFGGYYIYNIHMYIYILRMFLFFSLGQFSLLFAAFWSQNFPFACPLGFWLLAFGFWPLAFVGFCWLLLALVGFCWLLLAFVGFWLWFHLAFGCWLHLALAFVGF